MGYIGHCLDITERKQAEEEKEKLEARLRHAHKMESVGRLAGGVAHDFNNMLGVILGHTEIAMEHVNLDPSLRVNLLAISRAARHSADLTRQLLTFARKQTVAPKAFDLNEKVMGMLTMLQRLIGENVDLVLRPSENPWQVKMDPSQLEQIIANLCVNARDAITDIGSIVIETHNKTLDKNDCAAYMGLKPGEYVTLTVSDNGCGMDKETLAHIFEPFFTTKEVGKGTGLGLATVYGAVEQSNGFITVYSEPGQGTTFSVYLPRYKDEAVLAQEQEVASPAPCGHETILLVEDEPALLELTAMTLEKQGYTVLSASAPGDAIRLAREYGEEIDLLLTDVIMPAMNGRDLAQKLLTTHPNIKKLFMSGYAANIVSLHGVLDKEVHFIQKPFCNKNLAAKVRAVLDSR